MIIDTKRKIGQDIGGHTSVQIKKTNERTSRERERERRKRNGKRENRGVCVLFFLRKMNPFLFRLIENENTRVHASFFVGLKEKMKNLFSETGESREEKCGSFLYFFF